jgi:hypothetical protein
MKLKGRRPPTSRLHGAASLFMQVTPEPTRQEPRVAATSASPRSLIIFVGSAGGAHSLRPRPGASREAIYPYPAIDVHKKQVTVAVRIPGQAPGQRLQQART